ncbi:hypothetical protein ACLOJK_018213 [Asimina triloba]
MADQKEHHTTTGVAATDGCELEKQQPSLFEKLQQRSDTFSSPSSDEEVEGQGGEKKKKKKKGLKEILKEKISAEDEDNSITIEKVEVTVEDAASDHEEKKGFLEKIKAKLPGSHSKKAEDGSTAAADHSGEAEGEKKGLFEKIKEKLPGYHKNGGEEKDKEKEMEISANH